MRTKYTIPFLIAGMLVTGCANSLFTKYQDMQCVEYGKDGKCLRTYNQPVYQTIVMCLGEACCFFVFKIISSSLFARFFRNMHSTHAEAVKNDSHDAPYASNGPTPNPVACSVDPDVESINSDDEQDTTNYNKNTAKTLPSRLIWLFWLPAAFDICGTTLMNVGLFFTPVSVFQMTRGALVLWVGLFSVIFLKRKLSVSQWISLFMVMGGVMVVGVANMKASPAESDDSDIAVPVAAQVFLGVMLILFAQIFTASQFVTEEKILTHYSVEPLRAVGYEGIFGLLTTLAAVPILYYTIGRTENGRGGYFDAVDGLRQIRIPTILWSSIATATSIGFFNFFGLAVTRSVSATSRSTVDTCRTLGIWVVSLMLGWEQFYLLQLVGFAMLVYGTFVFNQVLSFPFIGHKEQDAESDERTALLSDSQEPDQR